MVTILKFRGNYTSVLGKLFSNYVNKPKTNIEEENLVDVRHTKFSKYGSEFYNVPCVQLAKKLLGQIIVRQIDKEKLLRCRIVETEAYLGGEDKASHANATKRPTKRTKSSYMCPGTSCISCLYGVHFVFGVSSQGDGASVLIRAAEPISGAEEMRRHRALHVHRQLAKPRPRYDSIRLHRLCSGPGRLAAAMNIGSHLDGHDLAQSQTLWIEQGPEAIGDSLIVECPRIGLSSALGQWAYKPLRYYVLGHTSVSHRNKTYEKKLLIASGILSEDGKMYI